MVSVLLTLASNQSPPADDDVVAGGWGAIVLVGLIIAVVLLGFSLAKQLRKVREADEAGVYGRDDDEAAVAKTPAEPAATEVDTPEQTDGQQP